MDVMAAKESERQGLYRDACEFYKKAGASFRDIRRCDAKAYAEEGDFHMAVCCAIIARDLKSVKNYAMNLEKKDDARQLIDALFACDVQLGKWKCVSDIVDRLFDYNDTRFSSDEIVQARLFCIEQMDNLFLVLLNHFETCFEIISCCWEVNTNG